MTEPRVSVIMAAYNAAAYLPATLNSLLAQTEPNWELIAVNDGSTDGTLAVLEHFAAQHPITIINQPNAGLGPSRNRAIAAAHAPLVALLDADDLWQPNYLTAMLAALDADPGAVAVFSGWQYLDATGAPLPQTVIAQAAGLPAELTWRNPLVPSGAVIRRAALTQCNGFDPALRGVEDWDLWLRLAPLGHLLVVPRPLVLYRTHVENMSDQVDLMEASRHALLVKHFGPLPADPAAGTPRQRRMLGALYFDAALGYLRQRRAGQAQAKLTAALRAWPAFMDSPEFYYELACAYQPRGRRGQAGGPEWAEGAALLRRVVLEGQTPPATNAQRRAWWGQAGLVLAQLAPDRRTARRYAAEALRWSAARHKPTALRAWLRATLPAPIVGWARRLWHGPAPNA